MPYNADGFWVDPKKTAKKKKKATPEKAVLTLSVEFPADADMTDVADAVNTFEDSLPYPTSNFKVEVKVPAVAKTLDNKKLQALAF